jgi:hypothetical protein
MGGQAAHHCIVRAHLNQLSSNSLAISIHQSFSTVGNRQRLYLGAFVGMAYALAGCVRRLGRTQAAFKGVEC